MPMNDLPKVSIVVPCYNAQDTVLMCAKGCLSQDYPNLEIIFVDDGSTDRTLRLLREFDDIKVISQNNKGPAAARNLGWRSSQGEIICFTDSDCIPNRTWVTRFVKCYFDQAIDGVGGSYDIVNSDKWLSRCIHEEIIYRHKNMPKFVDYLGSFNVSYKRDVLVELSGFDESFLRASGEDNDLAYRAVKYGYKLMFDKENLVAHHHPEKISKYIKQQFWHGYWRLKLYFKHTNKISGDHYADSLDFIQIPISFIASLLIILGLFIKELMITALLFLVLFMVTTFPMIHEIVVRKRSIQYYPYSFVVFLRANTRFLGILHAIFRLLINVKKG